MMASRQRFLLQEKSLGNSVAFRIEPLKMFTLQQDRLTIALSSKNTLGIPEI